MPVYDLNIRFLNLIWGMAVFALVAGCAADDGSGGLEVGNVDAPLEVSIPAGGETKHTFAASEAGVYTLFFNDLTGTESISYSYTASNGFGFGSSSRVSTAHIAAISIVCGAMCLPWTLRSL